MEQFPVLEKIVCLYQRLLYFHRLEQFDIPKRCLGREIISNRAPRSGNRYAKFLLLRFSPETRSNKGTPSLTITPSDDVATLGQRVISERIHRKSYISTASRTSVSFLHTCTLRRSESAEETKRPIPKSKLTIVQQRYQRPKGMETASCRRWKTNLLE